MLSAYKDNAAVIAGWDGRRLLPDPQTAIYREHEEPIHILMKVETHNHPTAIAPDPGAATGSGGEIRDEGATGQGAKPKAGLSGFSVSNLRIPGLEQPWEQDHRPTRAHRLGPGHHAGGAHRGGGLQQRVRPAQSVRLLPHLRAGGAGARRWPSCAAITSPSCWPAAWATSVPEHVDKRPFPAGTPLVVLGGPAMLIGLGGGAASSMATGASAEDLDFASVQRANPEMQRRCQEVIDRCWAQGEASPILFIHDVGAGGLSNALPELVHDAGRGARFELRSIPNDEPGMSPLEIWCNEAQERYVLAVAAERLAEFEAICERERCPYAVVGEATEEQHLRVDRRPLRRGPHRHAHALLFGKPPRMHPGGESGHSRRGNL